MSIFMFEWIGILMNATKLYADGNNFIDFNYCDTPLTLLRTFSASQTLLNTNGLSFATFIPNLEIGIFSQTSIDIPSLINCTALTKLDLSKCRLESDEFNSVWPTIHLINLQTLIFSNNRLTSIPGNAFDTTPSLTNLDLSFNQISTISQHCFSGTKFLTELNLQNNQLTSTSFLRNVRGIVSLNIAHNKLSEVSTEVLNALATSNNSKTSALDLSGNPFVCNCEVIDFRDWLSSDRIVYVVFYIQHSMYQCAFPNATLGRSVTDVSLDCSTNVALYVGITVSSFVCITVVGLLCRRYRWRIKYRWFILWRRRRRRRLYNQYLDNDIDLDDDMLYDVYVSYCEESNRDERWVANDLRINLENNEENPLKLFIKARDFIPGDIKVDAVAANMTSSRKTIAVLSESFMDDEWCYFEMQMALNKLFEDGCDVLILVRLEDIPDDKLTMSLRQLLCRKQCLNWPQ